MERIRDMQEEGFKSGAIKRARRKGKLKPRPATWDSDLDGEWEYQPGAFEIADAEEEEVSIPARHGRVVISDDEESVIAPPARKPAPKRAPAKKAPAKTAAKAPAKKAPAKAPAKGREKATEISDDEDDDIIMMDKEPPRAQPRRGAAPRSTGRQTQLNFSQAKSQPRELSDDEISDEDDAFEPMPATRRR
jgi:double-strand break repair protein MRE11